MWSQTNWSQDFFMLRVLGKKIKIKLYVLEEVTLAFKNS